MTREHIDYIISLCPSLFGTKESFSIGCNDGWVGLLTNTIQKISQKLSEYPECVRNTFLISSIETVDGRLTIHSSEYIKEIEDIILDAETESETICEICGNVGSMREHFLSYVACEEHTEVSNVIEEQETTSL